jgi:transglutaminase-like putative cysteine protease
MSIIEIKHLTTYHYNKSVSFGKHRMMLLPRDDDDQKVVAYELEIAPRPICLEWSRDTFGNYVATAEFDEAADKLRFVSNVRLEHAPTTFDPAKIDNSARHYPFTYSAKDWSEVKRYIKPPSTHRELNRWSAALFCEDGSADLYELLVGMTQMINETIGRVSRHEKGIQDPTETLHLRSGSCRDVAVLMIAALRSRAIAARFVSGYVHLLDHDEDHRDLSVEFNGGNTHAWVQVYVPGPGWIDFDPAAGVPENHNLIRVAAVQHPREAIPLQGTWYGSASDYLTMNVGVRVRKNVDLTSQQSSLMSGTNR